MVLIGCSAIQPMIPTSIENALVNVVTCPNGEVYRAGWDLDSDGLFEYTAWGPVALGKPAEPMVIIKFDGIGNVEMIYDTITKKQITIEELVAKYPNPCDMIKL